VSTGSQNTKAGIDGLITDLARRIANDCAAAAALNKYIGKLGVAGLQALDPAYGAGTQPADAAPDAVAKAAILNTIAAIYYGQATQGTTFNFDDALVLQRMGQA
jgi:hypothetical protein